MPATGYILDTVTQERWDMQFNPEGLELTLGATWSEKATQASSVPRAQYRGGKARTFPLNLVFLRTTEDGTDIDEWRRRIESLPFPDYEASGQLLREPHIIRIGFGPWRSLRCIVEEVQLTFGPHFLPDTLTPSQIAASLKLREVPIEGSLGRDDVRGGL